MAQAAIDICLSKKDGTLREEEEVSAIQIPDTNNIDCHGK